MKGASGEGEGKADITVCGGGESVDVRCASGEGGGTGEMELGVVLKPEIVGFEPTVRGVDMLDEFQILPGPPRKAVWGLFPKCKQEERNCSTCNYQELRI